MERESRIRSHKKDTRMLRHPLVDNTSTSRRELSLRQVNGVRENHLANSTQILYHHLVNNTSTHGIHSPILRPLVPPHVRKIEYFYNILSMPFDRYAPLGPTWSENPASVHKYSVVAKTKFIF